jgi:hypothetical protein
MLLSLVLLAASEPRPLTLSPALDLQLDAPPECSHAAQVVAAVDGLVHTTPAQPLEVRAKISVEPRGYALHATFGAGMREVRGDSCEAVTQALIAITALAIDPSVRLSVAAFPALNATDIGEPVQGASAPSRVETAAATDGRIFSQAPPPRLRSDSAGDWRPHALEEQDRAIVLGASLLGLGEWGALPEATYGASGFLRASQTPWSAEIGGSWLRPRWVQVEQAAVRKGGTLSWLAAQANGCRALGRWAAACGGFELGRMSGEGQGVSNEEVGHALWLAAALGALGRWPLGREFSLEARATTAFPLYRPEFSLEPYGALHQASWVSARLSLGIGFR